MEQRDRHAANINRGINDPPDDRAIFEEIDGGQIEDIEVEARLSEWLDLNKVENSTPFATLYKFKGPVGDAKEQVDYFRGVFPSRHEIGLDYGSGRYMMIVQNATTREKKGTSVRFTLHESYDEKSRQYKREKAEKERLSAPLVPAPSLPAPVPVDNKASLMEALSLVRSMQNDTLLMFRPFLEKAIAPAASREPVNPFQEYALTRQILKDNMKENITMFSTMQKALIESKTAPDLDGDDESGEEQKEKGLFEKIIELAGPFINILAENNTAAKLAAAGIKAAPQFKEVIHDVGLARRVIQYVEQKEGPERANIALRNLGISRGDYFKDVTPGEPGKQAPGTPTRAKVVSTKKAPQGPVSTLKQKVLGLAPGKVLSHRKEGKK